MIALLVMTDGRAECLERTLPVALEMLDGRITQKVIHDDSADPDYRAWIVESFPTFTLIGGKERRGFGGAIQAAWRHVRKLDARFIFHLEDDFLIKRPVALGPMSDVLLSHPRLQQMALLRNPVNEAEVAAGGVIECAPQDFERVDWKGMTWREHRQFWTTNPSLYRSTLTWREWPDGAYSEGRFTADLLSDPGRRSAYWDEGEWCEHIGVRSGHGY